ASRNVRDAAPPSMRTKYTPGETGELAALRPSHDTAWTPAENVPAPSVRTRRPEASSTSTRAGVASVTANRTTVAERNGFGHAAARRTAGATGTASTGVATAR